MATSKIIMSEKISYEGEITISLGVCRNLRPSRVDAFTIFGQVSLGKTVLGESSRLEYKATADDEDYPSLHFEVKHLVQLTDPLSVDELVRNPLLVSVFEVLPKDKRAKEEKTQLLGIANLDLLPLLQGQTHIERTLKLQSLNVTPPSTHEDLPELDVTLSVLRSSLLTPEDIVNSNILSLRVKGLYSLPDGWSPSPSVTFTVATPKPHHSDIEETLGLSVMGGEIKSAGEVDLAQSMQLWKWAELSPSTAGLSSLTDHVLEVTAIEDESGQLSSQEDINFRRMAESLKPRVVFNSELRSYLSPSANARFLHQLSCSPLWPVEILRISSSSAGRGKVKEEETVPSHHGIAYLDLSSLLYPGVTRVFGAYCVENMNEADLPEKTNNVHTRNVMELFFRNASGKKDRSKKFSTVARTSTVSVVSQVEPVAEVKGEGTVYSDAKSYFLLEFELAQPLVPKRPISVIAEKISEYIIPHPPLPRRISGVEKAVKDFHACTTDVAGLLLADYRSLFSSILEEKGELPNTGEDIEERKRQLLYMLNTSGRYHAYKEHMKRSVISLVRERFLNEANTKDEAEMQAFLSRLYTYLVNEMHISLGKVFSLEDSSPVAPTIVDCDMLRQYASEAESMLDLGMAEYYHKELLSREEHIALHWYDYGVFSLLKGDIENSKQCLKRAVALDQQFVPALLLYGMCCSLDERCCNVDESTGITEAEEMMELATTIDSGNLVAWTIRGLCYEMLNKTHYRDMCFQEAQKLLVSNREKTYIIPLPKQQQQQQQQSSKEIEDCGNVTTQSISQEIEAEPAAVAPLEKEQDPVEHSEPPEAAEHDTKDDQTKTGKDVKKSSDKKRAELSPFLHTSAYLLDVHAAKYAEMCLAHENILQSHSSNKVVIFGINSKDSSSAYSVGFHVAVARLHLLKADYQTAEKHLLQAIKDDVLNSNLLALLGHCLYLSGSLDEARDCYERVVDYVTPPANVVSVLLRLANIYMTRKEFSKAKQTYLRACRRASSGVTWRGVGIACYMLMNYSEAEDALSEANVLNNLDPVVWAYLALVCYDTGRNQEATQAVNFAIKTGLKDPSLVQQIKVIPCQ